MVCLYIFKQFGCVVLGVCGELKEIFKKPSNCELCNRQRGTTEGFKTKEIQ